LPMQNEPQCNGELSKRKYKDCISNEHIIKLGEMFYLKSHPDLKPIFSERLR
jgi:hypothetical protein